MHFKQKGLLWSEIDVCFEPYQNDLIENGAGNGSGKITGGCINLGLGWSQNFFGSGPKGWGNNIGGRWSCQVSGLG
jgi:hypothetical protein